ncbi:MAG: DUF167 domain-containing protein [Candidatus Aminicenantes bacterium]|nr:DUF167 domain-containing protein [Candidatus Aminicenantes bacterium]
MPVAGRRVLRVRVKPRSSRAGVVEDATGDITVAVHAPPDKGKANGEAVRLLAAHFGLPLDAVRIIGGAASRLKLVELAGAGRKTRKGGRRG